MKQTLIFAFALVFTAAASAQQYKWVDKNGKTRYGDVPPAGIKATALKPPAGPSGPSSAPAPGAGKAPASPDAEVRKRQIQAREEQEKQAKAAADADSKRRNCEAAQDQVRMIESGVRVARVNEKGERYFVDDEQRAKELEAARKSAADWCK